MDGIHWFEKGLDVLITFGSTFLGVLIAIRHDDKKVIAEKREKKINLINGIHLEVSTLLDFIESTPALLISKPYNIEARIIESTVKEQVKMLGGDVILELSKLRILIERMNQNFLFLKEAYLQKVGPTSGMGQWQVVLNNVNAEWNGFKVECKSSVEILKTLLAKDGDMHL